MYDKITPSDYLLKQMQNLPEKPGVYQFLDSAERIIYVGKAKILRRRVSSYFNKTPDSAKLAVMVRKIHNIQHTVVDTESDALLLENNLIKKYLPRYNVLLKDDKTFPWICIKNENFPRVFTTRNLINDGSLYFGPYTSGKIWKAMTELIRGMYKIRTCNLKLTQENIDTGKFKVCLEYHIGNCLGPCIGEQSKDDYDKQVSHIEHILKGKTQSVRGILKDEMAILAKNYEFEAAENVKQKLEMLERFQAKSTIVNRKITDVDVFSIVSDDRAGYVSFMKVVQGAIIQAHTLELKKRLEESDEELLEIAVVEIRKRIDSQAKELLLSHKIDYPFEMVKSHVPLRGDKKTLLDLSIRNAKYFKMERQKQQIKHLPNARVGRKLETLRKDLRLQNTPFQIECFDNSNIQGNQAVAACVVFKNAKPSKKDYRHYNIKTVVGPDDFASMKEVVFRRYRRLLDEGQKLPELVIIDGGKGQLNAALESLTELGLRGKISLVGIAKRLEEIYFPNDPIPLYLDKNSESLKLIQQLRNEAHRFGINHHRGKREKELMHSELDDIKGIGEKTRELLLQKFGSLEKVKEINPRQLEEVIGKAKAQILLKAFNPD